MRTRNDNSEFEPDYKTKRGNGSGTTYGYTVEARYNYPNPIKVGEYILDNRWREIDFHESQNGVPKYGKYDTQLQRHGLLGYEAAQALRWWLHAHAEAEHGMILCLESRIVTIKITYSHELEAVSFSDFEGEEK